MSLIREMQNERSRGHCKVTVYAADLRRQHCSFGSVTSVTAACVTSLREYDVTVK